MDPDVVTLVVAARDIGCHVETLRERIRAGYLPAMRGPHGVYLVKRDDLRWQRPPRRGRPPSIRPELSWEDEKRSWRELDRLLALESDDIRTELRLLKVLREEPEFAPELAHLAGVHRLRAIGWTTAPIADHLAISERQVRRLARRRLWRSLRYLLAIRRARLNKKIAHRRAQELIEILRERLNQEQAPRGAFRWRRHKLNAYERQGLLDAGVTEEELEAIWLKGLTHDQINYLLMKGFRGTSERGIAIRTKDQPLSGWQRRLPSAASRQASR
jgi:hypothetical protein